MIPRKNISANYGFKEQLVGIAAVVMKSQSIASIFNPNHFLLTNNTAVFPDCFIR
jgi:hypothetical protein